ncbi:MAG: hypothetical protein ACD_62C00198G0002 [uncultured bacterium]|nr:MAG: hypothetical protein ACD_62C00198G0002 [uncultured bacterium]HLD44496.1 preprotein translocase subunit SecE [bacterium]
MKNRKIVTICLILVAVFLYWVASQICELLFDWFNLAITRDYFVTIPDLIGAVCAGVAFALTLRHQRFMSFLEEAVTELSKVTYPTTKESGQSAVVVVILVGIATTMLALYDLFWSTLTRWILN